MESYKNDIVFLKKLYTLPIREEYIKVWALNWDEQVIKEIRGSIIADSGGNLSYSGDSAQRRQGSLSFVADAQEYDLTEINGLFSINSKIKLFKGIKNTVPPYTYLKGNEYVTINYQQAYGDIVWFPLGVYLIFDPSISHSVQGINISFNIKDKMSLLNGDAGGIFPSSVTLSEAERWVETSQQKNENGELLYIKPDGTKTTEVGEKDAAGNIIKAYDKYMKGEYVIENPTIFQVIMEVVNHFGNEDLTKIIIQDIDERALGVVKFSADNVLYYNPLRSDQGRGFFLDRQQCIEEMKKYVDEDTAEKTIVTYDTGQDIGYIFTDFTYPGELIANVGDTVTSILDKIIALLGNYEYFYDVDGFFHFQEKKNYLNTSYVSTVLSAINNEQEYNLDYSQNYSVWDFTGGGMYSEISDSIVYSNIKNDYVIWGKRTNSQGMSLPIRYHFAIDKRPTVGHKHKVVLYKDEFNRLRAVAAAPNDNDIVSLPTGGYQDDSVPRAAKTRVDIKWKDPTNYDAGLAEWVAGVDDPSLKIYIKYKDKNAVSARDKYQNTTESDPERIMFTKEYYQWIEVETKWYQEELYYQGVESELNGTQESAYWAEMKEEFPKVFNLASQAFDWNSPTGIDWYLDILDDTSTVGKFSISNIGKRSVYISNDDINCVFEAKIPDIILIESGQPDTQTLIDEANAKGYEYVQVSSNIYKHLSFGGASNSAYQRMTEEIYEHLTMSNGINMTCIPMYHLEPNTRITIYDEKLGIHGDFITSSISIPLGLGEMSISASTAYQKI